MAPRDDDTLLCQTAAAGFRRPRQKERRNEPTCRCWSGDRADANDDERRLDGEPVALSVEGGKWQLPVQVPAGVGGHVIQIRSKMGGQPFAEW